jgi:D-alanyl-lipoteichoic acid acyltransferase DltB (MBOAT superfamily)
MAFNSYAYLLLLVPVIAIYWQLPLAWRLNYVIAVSLAYYATWYPAYTPLPVAVCAVTYFCGRRVERDGGARRLWLKLGIALALLVLAFFKYRDFLGLRGIALLLPLGISFYVFECISYLLDTYQGRVKKPRFRDLLVFVAFWPHLMAGPIVRFRELVPQFAKERRFDAATALRGLDRLLLGILQKNLLANTLGGLVDEGFLPAAAATNSTIDNWALALGFGLQIYFDFASYSNMAIGAAQLMGITLPENFRHPYHAATPPEFWSRWHMTLSRWIRDYLFFPINAKYAGARLPLYTSLIGIMGLVGLWHGAGWGFIAWGLLHGVYLVLYRAWEHFTENRKSLATARPARLAWHLFTLVAVMAAWIPFRAPSLRQSATMLRSMFARPSFHVSFNVNSYLIIALIAIYALVEPWIDARLAALDASAKEGRRLFVVRHVVRPALYALALFLFLSFDDQDRQFIYFQF